MLVPQSFIFLARRHAVVLVGTAGLLLTHCGSDESPGGATPVDPHEDGESPNHPTDGLDESTGGTTPVDPHEDGEVPVVETGFALRIDCGATTSTTDSKGRRWEADRGFSNGSEAIDRSSVTVDGTDDAFIYRSERSKIASYSLEVPNGTYLVRLHFAETELDAASLRRMRVAVEGQTLPDIDLFVAAGGKARANVQEFRHVLVSDGEVDIVFASPTNNAKIDGIEILADVADPTPEVLTLYTAPDGIAASEEYEVTVNGQPLFVYRARASIETQYRAPPHVQEYETMGFAYFDFEGEVRVEITPKAEFETVNVRPSWKGVTPRVENGKIVLTLKEPKNLSVELNGSWHQPLFLFANPPETDVPDPNDPNVVYFGPGVHNVPDYREIASNQIVYIAGGAVVRARALTASNKSNVTVRGRGILDSSNQETHSTHQMRFVNVDGLKIEGIIFQDSPSWTAPIYESSNIEVHNIKMLGYRQNTDCLDLVAVQNVVIEKSFLRCFDDGVTIKAYAAQGSTPTDRGSSNIRVQHNTIWTDWGYAALDVGAELRTPTVSNLRFVDNDVLHPMSAAIAINNSEQALVEDVEFNDTRVEDPRRRDLVHFVIDNNPNWSRYDPRGYIDGVKIDGLRFLNGSAPGIDLPWRFLGFDATHRIANVAFTDTWLLGTHITSASVLGSALQTNQYVTNLTFEP